MNRERLISTFIDLCSIPSPSKKEAKIADYIRRRAETLDLHITEDNAGKILNGDTNNLIVKYKGKSSDKPIFLVSHMDTVPVPDTDRLKIIVENDKIKTDGTHVLGADDKAGVALALELMEELTEERHKARSVDFIFTVQEELGTLGASVLDPKIVKSRAGFVLDSEFDIGTAINESCYKKKFTIGIYGKSSHAAVSPEKGVNSVKVLGTIISKLPTGKIGKDSVINLAYIKGGRTTNVVPDYAELKGEIRSYNKQGLSRLIKKVEDYSKTETYKYGARAKIVWEDMYSGYTISEDALCSAIFKTACRKNQTKPVFVKSLGGSDANRLNNMGMECIVLGLGMKEIHSGNEYILKEDLIKAYNILYSIAVSQITSH